MNIDPLWWDEKAGFFGEFYIYGDDSIEGHLASKQLSQSERTLIEVNGISNLLELKDKKKILDIPCGYGRHSINLALRGHEIVGVDINKVHLSKARLMARENGVDVKFHENSMLSINYRNEFDVLINMFYSFGFFYTDHENLRVLKNFYAALKPNGKFLMHTDVNIPRIHSGKYKLHETRRLKNDDELIIDEFYNGKFKRIDGTWTIKSKNKEITKQYSVRVYGKNEFVDMCLEVGFSDCVVFGGWHGEPYNDDMEEIIFVATK